jgi:hypothetical protein
MTPRLSARVGGSVTRFDGLHRLSRSSRSSCSAAGYASSSVLSDRFGILVAIGWQP